MWQPHYTAPVSGSVRRYVLVRRDSGMMGIDHEYLTAYYDPSYKGWCDVHNDRLTDSGYNPTHWMPLPEPPMSV